MKKFKLFIVCILCFTLFCPNVIATDLQVCSLNEVKSLMRILGILIMIIKIAVPIILLVTVMVDFLKCIANEKEFEKIKKVTVNRILAAILIFLVPTIVGLVANIVDNSDGYGFDECFVCLSNPSSCNVEDFNDSNNSNDSNDSNNSNNSNDSNDGIITNYAPTITSITKKGAIVTVKSEGKNKISGYYFSKSNIKPNGYEKNWVNTSSYSLEVAKYIGTYYVYVKDINNNISNAKSVKIELRDLYDENIYGRVPISRDKNKKYRLTTKLDIFLNSKGDSIENFNSFIANSVLTQGLFTGEGVITAGLAATHYLYNKYGVLIPYFSNVECAGTRYNEEFGANPNWGKKFDINKCQYDYLGFDCASFVGWALHNAGFYAKNVQDNYEGSAGAVALSGCEGSYKKGNRYCNNGLKNQQYLIDNVYKLAKPGDLLRNNSHIVLVLYRSSDSIYFLEAFNRVGVYKMTFNELYKEKFHKVIQMDGFYQKNESHACDKNGIPKEWNAYASSFLDECKK